MRLRIEVLIDLKLEKLAPFSQPSAHLSGFQPDLSGRALERRAVGMDATENALAVKRSCVSFYNGIGSQFYLGP